MMRKIVYVLAGALCVFLVDPAPPQPDGRTIHVVGDLTTADRVVILVPGVDTTPANFHTGLGGMIERAPAWQAARLAETMTTLDPHRRVAVIAWLGYDPPEGIGWSAARGARARTGADALLGFVDGLTAGHPTRTIAIVGHSYGSTVAGLAAPRLPAAVTDLVAIGSPGLGGASSVAELRTTARVWAGASPGDWTRRIPGMRVLGFGHGAKPTDPGFGALPLPAGDVAGHDGYFRAGTSSLRALARIGVTR
ncbi:alpha/beta hydrolase [Spirilliplanes yamanashiensis]|uniref:DUF1023 domain-containing protein n=1 Tax=Spirilliplanes yamanashiensis TaxID=42233 RepID=A0A8J4DKT0_9ACTN|nr:alpha/beta hydrolase [Spirilliplanes yamanashiensis]MDP9817555.1 pimeloyl-ACP methyl ester carboxylesterase [Spirilliplanes yamanashiensis]GIJ04365.1 hypothetical protein Sya03_37170 [Spirilliplanes yamanashiensis]